jgi:hypothetical protein
LWFLEYVTNFFHIGKGGRWKENFQKEKEKGRGGFTELDII